MGAKLIRQPGASGGPTSFDLPSTLAVHRLGAASASEICIRAEGISRNHARITRRDGSYWVEDAGSKNGTFVSAQRVSADGERLRHLDVLTLGRGVDLIFREDERDVEEEVAPSALATALEYLDGPSVGQSADVPEGEVALGRDASCGIVFNHPAVGRKHGLLSNEGGQVTIKDLNSANGTFVNGERVTFQVLSDGDRLCLGGVRNARVRIRRSDAQSQGDGETQLLSEYTMEWRTRLVWSPEELAVIEANRAAPIEAAPVEPPPVVDRAPVERKASVPKPKPPAPPVAPAADPDVAPTIGLPADRLDEMRPEAETVRAVIGPIRGVEVQSGDDLLRLGLGTHIVGRDPAAAVRLSATAREVSRQHAAITVTAEGVRLDDRSQNGTFVNDQPVAGFCMLQDGDRLRCGSSSFIVRLVRG